MRTLASISVYLAMMRETASASSIMAPNVSQSLIATCKISEAS